VNKPQRRPRMKVIGSFAGKIKRIAELPSGKRLIATDIPEFYIWDKDKLIKVNPCVDAGEFKKYLEESIDENKS